MKMAVFKVLQFYYDEISIITNETDIDKFLGDDHRSSMEIGPFEHTVELGHVIDDPTKWRVKLKIALQYNPGLHPYNLSLSVVGFFEVSTAWANKYPEERRLAEMSKLISCNGSSLLYTSAREYLLGLTSRLRFGSIYLPTTSFKPFEINPDEGVRVQVKEKVDAPEKENA